MPKSMNTSAQMLATPDNLFDRLQPLADKHHKGDFTAFVSRLKRPYFRLSEEDYRKVKEMAGESDVLQFDGQTQVTWGDADSGFALMPLYLPL